MGRVGVLMLVVATAAVAAVAAEAAQSPKALRASILAAAKAQHSVHYETDEVVGNAALTITADVAATDGTQHVSFKAGKQTGHITILVLDQTAYVEGDTNGLEQLQGLTTSQATKYTGQWISIPKGDKSYNRTAAAVTLASFLQEITPRGRLSVSRAKLHGVRVIGVRAISGTGKKKKVQVLVARAHGKPLPLEEDELAPGAGVHRPYPAEQVERVGPGPDTGELYPDRHRPRRLALVSSPAELSSGKERGGV